MSVELLFRIAAIGLLMAVCSTVLKSAGRDAVAMVCNIGGLILALALVCSCFGFTFQPVAQRYTTADRAAQLCAINPLSTAVLSAIFLQERMGVQGIIGEALILLGIVLHNYHKAGADAGAMAEGETSHAA